MLSGIRPRKRLGQYFLRDRSVAKRIIDSMEICEGDNVVEIGGGEGVLTEFLLKSPAERIVGVEIDNRLADWLRERFIREEKFELIEGDFLKLDLSSLIKDGKKIRVVGNIPYYITKPILFHILESRSWVQDITATVQKEVGERISSRPGTKVYGVLSVLFQVFGQVDPLFFIPRDLFYPVPEVDSSVIRIRFFNEPLYEIKDLDFFRCMVKTVFAQRRKMLRNTLKNLIIDEKMWESVLVDLSQRPEELSVVELVQLSNELVTWKNKKI